MFFSQILPYSPFFSRILEKCVFFFGKRSDQGKKKCSHGPNPLSENAEKAEGEKRQCRRASKGNRSRNPFGIGTFVQGKGCLQGAVSVISFDGEKVGEGGEKVAERKILKIIRRERIKNPAKKSTDAAADRPCQGNEALFFIRKRAARKKAKARNFGFQPHAFGKKHKCKQVEKLMKKHGKKREDCKIRPIQSEEQADPKARTKHSRNKR